LTETYLLKAQYTRAEIAMKSKLVLIPEYELGI